MQYDFRQMENIRVIGRFRPANDTERREEKRMGDDNGPSFLSSQQVKLQRPDHQAFSSVLDHFFKPSSKQKNIFQLVGRPMVQACLEGYNATIFAYGQTGSGKTWTMFGPEKRNDETELGLVPRCCTYLFQQLKKKSSSAEKEISAWQLSVEFIQIYKEQLLDLLEPKKRARLQIRTNFQTDTPYVENLKKTHINGISEMLVALSESHKNRIVASHKLNAESSRSHMLVMLTLEQQMKDGSVKRSKLNFGDLAGSEDITKALGAKPDPERLKEAIAINSSLSALTTAISNLSKSQRPSYRSSALTHILQDSLGGNSKTTMIVNASPHKMNRKETIRTLRFAATAKTVVNKARINKQLTRAQLLRRIQELEAHNTKLSARVIELEGTMQDNGIPVTITKELYVKEDGPQYSDDDSEDETGATANKTSKKNVGGGGKKPTMQLSIDSQTVASKSATKVQLSVDSSSHNVASSHSIPALLKQIQHLEHQLEKQMKLDKELADKNMQLESELEALQKHLDDNRQMLEEVQDMNRGHVKKKTDLQKRITNLTDELNSTSTSKESEQRKLDKRIQQLQDKYQMSTEIKADLQKQAKELTLQVSELERINHTLQHQLKGSQKNGGAKRDPKLSADWTPEPPQSEEEKDMSPAEVLMNRFAPDEIGYGLTQEQKIKKTGKLMTDLSNDIGSLMKQWLPEKNQRSDRKQSKALVYQVRQLIGHFNVAVGQLKETKESFQNDMRLTLKKKDQEIETLRADNRRVLQLQDDLAEKDEQIEGLMRDLENLRSERDQLEIQSREMQNLVDDVQSQVVYLENELERTRSTVLLPAPGGGTLADDDYLDRLPDDEEFSDDEETKEDESVKAKKAMPRKPLPELTTRRRQSTVTAWREAIKTGTELDCLDQGGLWWTARVVDTKDGNLLKIRYDGWGDKYDEWIARESPRLAVYKSKYAVEKEGKKIIKEGMMSKQGKMFHTWRKRYFVLFDNGTMNYYQNKGDPNPISSLDVKEMIETKRVNFGRRQQLIGFELQTDNRLWKFVADSDDDVLSWIHAIHHVKNGMYDEE